MKSLVPTGNTGIEKGIVPHEEQFPYRFAIIAQQKMH